jgi:hypothetical protein
VPANGARHLAAARRVPDVNGIVEIQFLDECREIVGIGIDVITGPRLARPSVAPSIVRNAPVPAICQEHHLVFPGVIIQRRTVAGDDRLPSAPVLEEDLSAVADSDGVTPSRGGRPELHHIPPFEAGFQTFARCP